MSYLRFVAKEAITRKIKNNDCFIDNEPEWNENPLEMELNGYKVTMEFLKHDNGETIKKVTEILLDSYDDRIRNHKGEQSGTSILPI